MIFLFLLIALIALSYTLSRSTDVLISGINQLAKGTAVEASGLTAIVVGLATSLPELFISIVSALEHNQTLPLGLVMGSNIANISLVIGGAALFSGLVKARDEVYKREIVYAFLIGTLPLVLLLDKQMTRIDGLVLLIVYLIYSVLTLTKKRTKRLKKLSREYYEETGFRYKVLTLLGKKDVSHGATKLAIGVALIIICANLIVNLSETIAGYLKIPIILVGLFLISIGSTLPELSFGIKTIAKKEYLMAFSNLVGSVVVNSSLILGIVALIAPYGIGESSITYYLSVIGFVVLFGVFWLLTYSEKRLDRWEGLLLILIYFAFLTLQFGVNQA